MNLFSSTHTINPKDLTIGLDMYQAYDERKKATNEQLLMRNRIQKLMKEEQNAKRHYELVQKRAEEIMRAKEKHLSFLLEKQRNDMKKAQEEEEARAKLNEFKRKQRERIRKASEDLISSKYSAANEVKKQSKMNMEMYKKYLDVVKSTRKEQACLFKENKAKLVKMRSRSVIEQQEGIRDEYLRVIQEHKNEYLRMMNEKSELAKMETEMLRKISDTRDLEMKTLMRIKEISGGRSFSQTDNY